jgi:S-adenosyl methyltransferase
MGTMAARATASDGAQSPGAAKTGRGDPPPVSADVTAQEFGKFDPTRPNIARVYDYWLGGKDNFAADRDLAERTLAMCPELPEWARDNRAFVCAAAERAAQAGITQFIDLGCGLPTRPAVHEAVRSVNRDARVAYVDFDPVVICHARALLHDVGVTAVQADLSDPDNVLAQPEVREVIDPGVPACAIFGGVLHFMSGGRARQICADWADRLASGSWLAVTVGRYQDPELLARLTTMYTPAPFHNHTPDEFATFLAGLDLVAPGVAEARRWRAGVASRLPDHGLYALCAAAIKR